MRNGKFRSAVFAASCACFFGCCQVPPHRLPHGFSSSYHRQLYGMEPVVIGGIPDDQIPPNTSPGVFFPERIQLSAPPSAAAASPEQQAQAKAPPVNIPPAPAVKKAASKSR